MELSESIVLSLLMYLLAIAISIVAAFVVHGIVVIVSRMETPASAPVEKRPGPAMSPPSPRRSTPSLALIASSTSKAARPEPSGPPKAD